LLLFLGREGQGHEQRQEPSPLPHGYLPCNGHRAVDARFRGMKCLKPDPTTEAAGASRTAWRTARGRARIAGMAETHYRACHLCEAMCGIAIETEGGKIVAIRGDADDPFSR